MSDAPSSPRAPSVDISTPAGRWRAWSHIMLKDHGLLRRAWRNEHEIAPGVWRANQPDPTRMAEYARRGFKSVLVLRGKPWRPPALMQVEAAEKLGMTFKRVNLGAKSLVPKGAYLKLLDAFEDLEKPFVMHCKSGSDRTGLASFLYLVSETDTPPEVAKDQLAPRFLHLPFGKASVLDYFVDSYIHAHASRGISIRDWLESDYDQTTMTADWAAGKRIG